MALFDLMTRVISPYQLNPLDFNPLREVLEQSIDFKRLRRHSPIQLHIAATDVATGKPRVFRNAELSAQCLLASACLPQLHRAVKVGRRHYWDGGFSANPAILPLVEGGVAEDTLIVQLDPPDEHKVPTNAHAIVARHVEDVGLGVRLARHPPEAIRLVDHDLALQTRALQPIECDLTRATGRRDPRRRDHLDAHWRLRSWQI